MVWLLLYERWKCLGDAFRTWLALSNGTQIVEESGSGKKIWAGSGQINNTIHSSTKIHPPAGFISTEPVRIDYCSTITGTNAGLYGQGGYWGNELYVLRTLEKKKFNYKIQLFHNISNQLRARHMMHIQIINRFYSRLTRVLSSWVRAYTLILIIGIAHHLLLRFFKDYGSIPTTRVHLNF